jgi:DNA-binding protein H-NS
MQLKSMSLDRLVDLREKVETALMARIAGTRSELESRLAELSELGSAPRIGRGAPRGRVPPKYRNPENPDETWSGRGLPPRWLAAAPKRGGRLEDFLIEGGLKRRRKTVAKARRAKATRRQATPRKTAAKAGGATKHRKATKPRTVAKPRKAAKTPKPLRAKMARRPRRSAEAPGPAPAAQSGVPTSVA